jgi:hypothetical protein
VEAATKRPELRLLSRRIEGILGHGVAPEERVVVPTGWGPIDGAIGGLAVGAIHEWFGAEGAAGTDGAWSPPLALLIHLAWRALTEAEERDRAGRVLWIGRRVWPYPRALVGDLGLRATDGGLELARLEAEERPADPRRLLERSILVDVARPQQRVWALDLALRCPAVTAVVADASGLDMAATRRLQLAAEAGGGLGLLARPPREESELSVAATRWRVRRARSGTAATPRQALVMLRCKSVRGNAVDLSSACVGSARKSRRRDPAGNLTT